MFVTSARTEGNPFMIFALLEDALVQALRHGPVTKSMALNTVWRHCREALVRSGASPQGLNDERAVCRASLQLIWRRLSAQGKLDRRLRLGSPTYVYVTDAPHHDDETGRAAAIAGDIPDDVLMPVHLTSRQWATLLDHLDRVDRQGR